MKGERKSKGVRERRDSPRTQLEKAIREMLVVNADLLDVLYPIANEGGGKIVEHVEAMKIANIVNVMRMIDRDTMRGDKKQIIQRLYKILMFQFSAIRFYLPYAKRAGRDVSKINKLLETASKQSGLICAYIESKKANPFHHLLTDAE